MKKGIVAIGLILVTIGVGYLIKERTIEMESVHRSKVQLLQQQIALEQLVVESHKTQLIGTVLLEIFLHNLRHGNAGQQDFDKCIESVNQRVCNQVELLNQIECTSEPNCSKKLPFWLDGERKKEYFENVRTINMVKYILVPWRHAAEEVIKCQMQS